MKVAIVEPGGIAPDERQTVPALVWLTERLARHHEVHVFALRPWAPPDRYHFAGATIHHVGPIESFVKHVRAILAEHRIAPFDLLHAIWAGRPGMVAGCAGRLIKRPVVLHIAGGELASLPDLGYGGMRTLRGRVAVKTSLRLAQDAVGASESIISCAATLGTRPQHVPLGVDVEQWPPQPPRPRAPNARPRLVSVGSLNGVKDQTTLIRAAKCLMDAGADFRLDIVGEDTRSGAHRDMANDLGLASLLTFHGFLGRGPLREVVDSAHVHVVSSRHEAGPVTVLEAAVAGVPTVGTAVGMVADLAPEAAVTVPVADPRALATAIADLLEDDTRRVEVATKAQRFALDRDAGWTATRYARIYQDVIDRRTTSPANHDATTTTPARDDAPGAR